MPKYSWEWDHCTLYSCLFPINFMHASPSYLMVLFITLCCISSSQHLMLKKCKQWCKGFISKDSQSFLCLHLSAECQLTGLSSASCVSYVHCETVFGHCAQNKCEQSLLLTYSLTLFTVSWRTRSSVSCTGSILICSTLIFGQLMSGLVYRVGANRTHGVGQASFIYSVCALSLIQTAELRSLTISPSLLLEGQCE